MTQKSPKISIKHLKKSFGSKKVLQDITLDIHPRESLVIIGGSGTGKSVLLKCILGLIRADTGSIQIEGQEDLVKASAKDLEEARKKMGMLFQGSALFDSLPVWENIFFGPLQMKKITREEAYAQASKKLAAVGLQKEVATLYPSELSGGMQRRVALARTLAGQPEIIFFDEPTTGLDPIFGGVINDLICKNVKEIGATALTITHDMVSARKIADRIAMIYEGHIIWQGTPKEIDKSENPYVEQFIHGRTQGPINVDKS